MPSASSTSTLRGALLASAGLCVGCLAQAADAAALSNCSFVMRQVNGACDLGRLRHRSKDSVIMPIATRPEVGLLACTHPPKHHGILCLQVVDLGRHSLQHLGLRRAYAAGRAVPQSAATQQARGCGAEQGAAAGQPRVRSWPTTCACPIPQCEWRRVCQCPGCI